MARHSRSPAQRTNRRRRYRAATTTIIIVAAVVALPSAEAVRDRSGGSEAEANASGQVLALPAGGAAGGAGLSTAEQAASLPRDVKGLREAAEAASRELAAANRRWVEQTERVKEAKAAADAVRKEAGQAAIIAASAREQLGVVAAAQYRHPDPGWALALTEDPSDALRDAEVLDRVGIQQAAKVTALLMEQARADQLVRKAADLAKSAEAEVGELVVRRQALMRRANEITNALTAALERLEEQRRASRAAERSKIPGCSPKDGYKNYPNGLVPRDALCPLPQPGHRLRADAAIAFWQFNDAFVAAFGRPICMTDSYRSLAVQRDLYIRKPGLAAVPGTSNHGWGLAVDLCGGAEVYGTTVYRWLDEHGDEFGWDNPSWARRSGSKPEAWHWEYVPGVTSLPS
jgi:D-alanyl-D-alanine carboxypeptidase